MLSVMIGYLVLSILDYVFRELAISYLGKEDLAHTPSIASTKDMYNESTDEKFLKIVKYNF